MKTDPDNAVKPTVQSPIDGEWVEMGGKSYLIPPLNFKGIKAIQDDLSSISKIEGMPTDEQLSAMMNVVHRAAVRNYPGMTLAELEELVDMGNMVPVLNAVTKASGLASRKPTEA